MPLANTAALASNNENLLSIPAPMPLSSILANNNPIPMLLKRDNQESIALSQNWVFYARNKHIDIWHH